MSTTAALTAANVDKHILFFVALAIRFTVKFFGINLNALPSSLFLPFFPKEVRGG